MSKQTMAGATIRWLFITVVVVTSMACVSARTAPPGCAPTEEAIKTSLVFDHGDRVLEGATYSCEAACPQGQSRDVVWEDNSAQLKLGVFNGKWQKELRYACIPNCREGYERSSQRSMDRTGTQHTYECRSVAERQAQEARAKKNAEDSALQREQAAAAYRQQHDGQDPGSCMLGCRMLVQQCWAQCPRGDYSMLNPGPCTLRCNVEVYNVCAASCR
jgi:predicted dehydrogenase